MRGLSQQALMIAIEPNGTQVIARRPSTPGGSRRPT